jgi:hypothetical protein
MDGKLMIGINEFVKRQTPESKFSHFEGTWEELAELVNLYRRNARLGYRKGIVLVRVPQTRFRSSIVPVGPDTPLLATFGSRREEEESHLGIVAPGGEKTPAGRVDIVLYSKRTLEETGEETGPEPWQVISINASPTEEEVPFAPIARARNILQLEGGTDAKLEAKSKEDLLDMVEDMARATIFWSQHVMVEGEEENAE